VPPTERKGRVHTSTVTVAVVDAGISCNLQRIPNSDLKIEWYSGTGSGGQFRNKHQNSCRITHLPTGEVATAQTRSRQNSLNLAMADIQQRVNSRIKTENNTKVSVTRKQQVGSGMRGDKIRTLQFNHDIATDHRTGKKMSASRFMKGHMDELWN
jgi:peptide chain release factor 1